jgi:hypothetical protein
MSEPNPDVEQFRRALRRLIADQIDFNRVSDDQFPAFYEQMRVDLAAVAEHLAAQIEPRLDAMTEATAIAAEVEAMLAAYERNRQERLAMGRPKRGRG